ncbi:Ger(x)C family spore germination protein [Fodinisporobacter ferrooxydans]|uniref:Ger(X)C family spore germination protein n=1 Tax=Fodinisporobacter ferrooxydans TaxID=2901836 RepID=A0ABY4CIK1_9BACL|nr:Ger(x)C family spore germination protein [Alicyclobacillaceae bacterium MYW30-H2]
MVRRKKQLFRSTCTIAFLLLVPFLLTGCWSSRELNRSALVAGAGFDKENEKYKMTIQILQPLKLIPKTRGQSKTATFITNETGQTVFETIRTFPHKTTRKLFWSHCQIFVIGREMAQESIPQTLDWFYRNQELRPLSFIILSKDKASDVIKAKTPLNPIAAYDVADTVKTLTDTSDAPIVHLMDFMAQVSSPVEAAYMPEMSKSEIVGTGVFLHDRLVGVLNLDESKGLLSLNGQVKSGQITVPAIKDHGKHMTVEIIDESTKKEARFKNGKPEVSYHLNYVVDIADDPYLFKHDDQTFHKIERLVEQRVKQDAVRCINKVKSYHADVIGAGEEIERQDPRIWERLVKNWEDKFPHIPIHVDVKVHVRHEGIIQGSK